MSDTHTFRHHDNLICIDRDAWQSVFVLINFKLRTLGCLFMSKTNGLPIH